MKRRRKKTTTRRRAPARRTTTRRKSTTRRRRRNPAIPFKAVGLGALAGLAVAAADFALRGMPTLTRTTVGLIEAAGLLVAGGLLASYSRDVGVGLAAAGTGVGGAHLASALIETKPAANGAKQLGAVQTRVGGQPFQLSAVQVPIGNRGRVAVLS